MMNHIDPAATSPTRWTYGYEILPPLPQDRLSSLEALLEEEQHRATEDGRTWVGRFVVREQVTHLLVVSDTADQELEANRRVEAELKRLTAAFSITLPTEVSDPTQGSLFKNRPTGPRS